MHILLKTFKKLIFSNSFETVRIAMYIYLFASIIYGSYILYENPEFSIVKILYFLVTTSTTVGYGDISPSSDIGMFLGSIYMVIGVVSLAMIFGWASENLINKSRKITKGAIRIMSKPIKLVIMGYPSENKIKELVSQLRLNKEYENEKILCVSNKVTDMPEFFRDSKLKIEFKKSELSSEDLLKDINFKNVSNVLILAEDPNNVSSDDSTCAVSSILKEENPELRIIAEKVRNEERLFELSSIDSYTRVAHALLLAQEILTEGAFDLEKVIFNNKNGGTQNNFIAENESTWYEICLDLIKEDKIPEGYKNPGEKRFNLQPKGSDVILKSALVKYR